MLISFNWLKKYVTLSDSIPAVEVATKLQAATVEVEKVLCQGDGLEGVVVGKIKTVEKHPNADKLKVCRVSLGNEEVIIVCGGSNVVEGMLVAVAKLGAKVRWHGAGEPIVMEKATIRGVDSFGMICASDEIGLLECFPKKEEREILDLSTLKVKPGTALAVALQLDDTLFEIDNKSLSHRPDLWGHYGLAREVAVLYGREVAQYKTVKIKSGKGLALTVAIENKVDCPRYSAVAMSGIKVAESPEWLKNALKAVGVRPINSVVDATNYVMFDCGQPLHAFDAAQLTRPAQGGSALGGNKVAISVRRARAEETLVTLDGVERHLDESILVIADSEKPLALAGVMGGKDSGITGLTTSIILESATFNPGLIRACSVKLGLRSDASMRFEKNLDPNLTLPALERVTDLLLELHPGAQVASAVVDQYGLPRKVQSLEMPLEFFAQKIGLEIPLKTIEQTLVRLGFQVSITKKTMLIKIPTWRGGKDITLPEDVVEEVLRLYGYDAVPAALPVFPVTPPPQNKLRVLERLVADVLSQELQFTEVYNYSFVSEGQIKRLGDDPARYLELDNPVSKEKPFIRRNLVPNLLEALERNIALSTRLALFEIGQVFRSDEAGFRAVPQSDELLPRQDSWLTAVYLDKKNNTPFFEARRAAEVIAGRTGCQFVFLPVSSREQSPWQHPARTAEIFFDDQLVGEVYEFHPQVSEKYGITGRVSACSINLSLLADSGKMACPTKYQTVSLYPAVERDIAFLVAKKISFAELQAACLGVDPLLNSVELFDVFEAQGIPEGLKSVALHTTYAHPARTLTSAEVEVVEKKVSTLLTKKFQAELRI